MSLRTRVAAPPGDRPVQWNTPRRGESGPCPGSVEERISDAVRQKWELWGGGLRLVILESPYRLLLEPLLQYIAEIAAQRQPDETITIVVPQFVPGRWWQNFLHNQTAIMLRLALLFRRGIVITDIPFHVE